MTYCVQRPQRTVGFFEYNVCIAKTVVNVQRGLSSHVAYTLFTCDVFVFLEVILWRKRDSSSVAYQAHLFIVCSKQGGKLFHISENTNNVHTSMVTADDKNGPCIKKCVSLCKNEPYRTNSSLTKDAITCRHYLERFHWLSRNSNIIVVIMVICCWLYQFDAKRFYWFQ